MLCFFSELKLTDTKFLSQRLAGVFRIIEHKTTGKDCKKKLELEELGWKVLLKDRKR